MWYTACMPTKEKDLVEYIALNEVRWGDQREEVRTFDASWHMALDKPRPVSVSFLKFVAKK
jgi:hypothetical protein